MERRFSMSITATIIFTVVAAIILSSCESSGVERSLREQNGIQTSEARPNSYKEQNGIQTSEARPNSYKEQNGTQTGEPRSSSYMQSSIGTTEAKRDTMEKEAFTFRPVNSWVGEHVIFLPTPKRIDPSIKSILGIRKYRLSIPKLHKKVTFSYWSYSEYVILDYNEYVGRIAKVLSARKPEPHMSTWVIDIEMVDSKKRFTVASPIGFGESFTDFALTVDIDNARTIYLGKTLWNIEKTMYTYDEATGNRGVVELKKYSPLKVTNIVAGFAYIYPVRFVLQTDSGEEGYMDVNISGTNVGEIERNKMRFHNLFLTQDPRITHKWPDEVWAAIEKGNVFIGMTAEQAKMSWGEPQTVNTTITGSARNEQWVYESGNYLYFENGVLTSAQQ